MKRLLILLILLGLFGGKIIGQTYTIEKNPYDVNNVNFKSNSFVKLSEINGNVRTIPYGQTYPVFLKDVEVEVKAFGKDKIIEKCVTDSNGIFFLKNLKYNVYYDVYFSKTGYYSRYITIDLNNIPDSLKEIKFYWQQNLKINLIKVINNDTTNPYLSPNPLNGTNRPLANLIYQPIKLLKVRYLRNADMTVKEKIDLTGRKDSLFISEGGIVQDPKYIETNKSWEQVIEKKLLVESDKISKKQVEDFKIKSIKDKYEKEKMEQEKLLLSQTNKLNEAEITKEKAVSASKQKELEVLEQGKQIQDLSLKNKEQELKQEQIKSYALYGGIAFLIVFGGFMFNRFKVTQKQKVIITKEKERSDELLLNILPAEVAEELKNTGAAKAKNFDMVTVLFTDFKNFTQASEKLNAEELVAEINYIYSAFDKIITKHNIEKIKTIGDSYMCAGGLPSANKSNPAECVRAALEINTFIETLKQQKQKENKPYFEIRIGLHTGPVVAGIVGIKKFAYDIWGDTVNIASRMESSGEAGKVNISGATYEIIKNDFKCTYRGKVQAKGKGEVDMYFVES